MADLAIGVSKTALDLVVTKVKDAIKEEEAQWQTVERDVVFITGEFEMMQSFLVSADGERVRNNQVARTWVRQVRDLSYNVEDCIEFVVHLDSGQRPWWFRMVPSWVNWVWPRPALPVDEAVAEITQLKARVVDVSQRNTRYSLISDDSGSKPAAPTTSSSAFGINTVGAVTDKKSGFSDIFMVLNSEDKPLQVISVSGATRFDIGRTSVIRKLYDNVRTRDNFERRAWVKLMDPFDPQEFIRSLVAQFLTDPCEDGEATRGVDELILKLVEIRGSNNLAKDFAQEVKTHRYLIVLDDVSSMEQWDAIKRYLPDRKNGSRVIVSTHHAEIAILCTGQPCRVSMLQRSSTDKPYHVFHKEIGEEASAPELGAPPPEAALFGRDVDAVELLELTKRHRHVSVWGPPGVGKTALVKSVYDRCTTFAKRSWANVSHPFDGQGLARELLSRAEFVRGQRRPRSFATNEDNLSVRKCQLTLRHDTLVVIDGLRSKREWDWIKANITGRTPDRACVICVTADERIAAYCAQTSDGGAVYRVNRLDDAAALCLFRERELRRYIEKFKAIKDEEVRNILSKCTGLPKFIVTLADYLGKQPVIDQRNTEIRLLSDNFMHQLETNSEFNCLKGLFGWLRSNFDASPQLLKKCIFYLSTFPQNSTIRRRRLVRRWIAEGYSKGTNSSSLVEEAEKLIDKLVDLWILLPQQTTATVSGATTSQLQVNSLFLEHIIASRQAEERTFLPLEVSVLEAKRSLATEHVGQHLAIHKTWKRDEFVYSGLDFSQLRSLTVFGKWKPFFISDKMRVVRVLDLESTTNLKDEHLDKIGKMLPRLKFLSLRGCRKIKNLPPSVCELRHLETLDIRHTSITMLPMSIVRLKNLQYVSAGKKHFFSDMDLPAAAAPTSAESAHPDQWRIEDFITGGEAELLMTPECGEERLPAEQRKEAEELTGEERLPAAQREDAEEEPPNAETEMPQSAGGKDLPTPPRRRRRPLSMRNLMRHLRASYVFSIMRQAWFQCGGAARRAGVGVGLPPGVENLKASLHTLGVVDGNSAAGMLLLFRLHRKLPQLRKLAACSLRHRGDTLQILDAISRHDNLRSLSLQVDKLLWDFSLPSSLRKLSLDVTGVLGQAAVDALMDHKKLRTLRLRVNTAEDDDGQPVVQFFPGTTAKKRLIEGRFDELKVLEIACSSRLHVIFSEQAMQKLELLRVHCCGGSPPEVSGLEHLEALKHVCLVGSCDDTIRGALQKELDEHPKQPKLQAL